MGCGYVVEEIGAGALFSKVALQVGKREVLMGELLNPAKRKRLEGGKCCRDRVI